MDKDIKLLLENDKLDSLYKNNLFSLKSICQILGVWDNYSKEDQYKLENFTLKDTLINKNFKFNGSYNINYIYGEILRSGVDEIIERINKYKKPTESDIFLDIGSGSGKVVLHIAIKTIIQTLIGVEIVPQRHRYSKYIQNKISVDKSVFFIEKDVLNFDISMATIIYMNNVTFDDDLIKKIYEKIPKGCHFMSFKEIPECKILKEKFLIDVSWDKNKQNLFYYIK